MHLKPLVSAIEAWGFGCFFQLVEEVLDDAAHDCGVFGVDHLIDDLGHLRVCELLLAIEVCVL